MTSSLVCITKKGSGPCSAAELSVPENPYQPPKAESGGEGARRIDERVWKRRAVAVATGGGWAYPWVLIASLLVTWQVAWAVLGHRPRASRSTVGRGR